MLYTKQLVLTLACTLWAVLPTLAQESIVDALQEELPFQGKVRIVSSPEITRLLGRKSPDYFAADYQKLSGYRVQFYSGNEPKRSKDEAFRYQLLINETFPEVTTYVSYKAPFWRLRAGDFRSQEEAFLLMKQIVKEIPGLKKESYVVKDEVQIPFNY